jgi:glycosyltransferase involved in cell wall biosynthesis
VKIALLTSGIFPFQIGGIQKHSYFFAKGLVAKKIYVDIFQSNEIYYEDLKEYYTDVELNYLNFFTVKFPQPTAFPGHYIYASYVFSKRLYNEIDRKKKYEVIYAQGFTSWYFLKKNPFQKNLISSLHGLEMFQSTINFKNKLDQILLKIPAKKIIENSNRQVSLGGKLSTILYDNGAKKGSVVEIPNGIDGSWIIDANILQNQVQNKKAKLIFIGRYERRKGIEELHKIIIKTIDELDYKIEFIGPIPKEKQIDHPNVNYMGLIKDSEEIRTSLLKADILVCPSYSEGMPTVILEAMECGCAIIATDVGAVSTIVNEKNGWLIKGDLLIGLEEAIIKALKVDSIKLIEMKRKSLSRVKESFT